MFAWFHKMLIPAFGFFAISAFDAEKRLGGKAAWMYLSRHRPDEAVIADLFQSIALNFGVAVIVGLAVIWMERRDSDLAVRRSPAEARAALRWPHWYETAQGTVERVIRLFR